MPVKIDFDPAKDAKNIVERGISLVAAAVLFNGRHTVQVDDRFDYGEERLIAMGEIAGRLHVCVFTMRGEVYRIISLRRANRREIDDWYD